MGKRNLMAMCHMLEMIHVKKGDELLLNRTDKKVVYFIKTGTVKVVGAQTEHTIAVLNMGNIFGELAIFESDAQDMYQEKAVMLEDGVVCVIEQDQMKMMLEKYSSLKNQLLKLHGLRIRKLQRNLQDLLYKDSETRITEYIINYVNKYGKKLNDSIVVNNLLSHKDIANLTNTSRQTVSNVLSKLRTNGVIDYNSKEIKIGIEN